VSSNSTYAVVFWGASVQTVISKILVRLPGKRISVKRGLYMTERDFIRAINIQVKGCSLFYPASFFRRKLATGTGLLGIRVPQD